MVWKITAEELLVKYDSGERNFAGMGLNRGIGNGRVLVEEVDLRIED